MVKLFFFLILVCSSHTILFSQIAINEDGNTPDASAILDLQSTSKGFLLPRMTSTDREAIENPRMGLSVYYVCSNCCTCTHLAAVQDFVHHGTLCDCVLCQNI